MIYKNAPIKEAVFDIQVSGLEKITQKEIEDLHVFFDKKYPKKRKSYNHYGQIEFKESLEISNETKSEFRGIIFSNEDNNRQVQFRLDGFTVNFLQPYPNWEEFYKEAFSLWKIYLENLKPLKIERIALRYINRIEIPLPLNSFQEYIVNMPPIPKSLPQLYSGFFMQIEVPCQKEGFSALITQTIETPNKSNVPFILDIDVFKIINNNDFDFEDFNYIREIKNSIFEDFITDKTRNLFLHE